MEEAAIQNGCVKVQMQNHMDCSALELGWSQELPAKGTDPLRLMALLRRQFGLGRYELSVRTYCGIGTISHI